MLTICPFLGAAMSRKENKSPSKVSPCLRCDNSTVCNDEPIKSPKPLPPSRSGFHGASLLAAFQKEYPPDLPESHENEENEEVEEDRHRAKEKEKEKGSDAMNHSRLAMYHAATALCHLLILTDTDDQKRFIYCLNSSLLLGGATSTTTTAAVVATVTTPPTFELTVLKGSIKTHVWSMAARYDDDYLLEVRHLPPLLQHQRHPSSSHSSSFSSFSLSSFSSQQQQDKDDEDVVEESNTELLNTDTDADADDIDADPVDLLWTMSGFELHTSQVGHGVVSWTNMKALHHYLCTQTLPHVAASLSALGVTVFSRLFSKVLLGLPMRETLGSYFKPMPATLM